MSKKQHRLLPLKKERVEESGNVEDSHHRDISWVWPYDEETRALRYQILSPVLHLNIPSFHRF